MSRLSRLEKATTLLALGGALLACQTEPERDLGWTLESRGQQVQDPEPTAAFTTPREDFAGRWVGTAEDPLALGGPGEVYTFPSGSTAIVLDLQLDPAEEPTGLFGSVALKGTVTFGGGPPPAPPTDGSLGYPLGVSYENLSYYGEGPLSAASYTGPLPPVEGFAYTLSDVLDIPLVAEFAGETGATDGVLTYELNTQEVLQPW
ncbi:MAG: hypothetical protein RL033_6511, partial [Pseudomonadota bacterium]